MLISKLSLCVLIKLLSASSKEAKGQDGSFEESIDSSSSLLLSDKKQDDNSNNVDDPSSSHEQKVIIATDIQPKKRAEYNVDRFKSINDFFAENQASLPKEIAEMVASYENDEPLFELYSQVMDSLKISKSERDNFKFDDSNFASQILPLIQDDNTGDLFSDNPFGFYLTRLFFKWMIYMRQALVHDNIKYEELLKDVKEIAFIIDKDSSYYLPVNFILTFDCCGQREIPKIKKLMLYEFADYPEIFYLFNSIIKDFYIEKKIKNCDDLRGKYFKGDFNNNLALKFMCIMYDPQERLRGECFPVESSKVSKNIISSVDLESKNGKDDIDSILNNMLSNGIKTLERFLDPSFIESDSGLTLFLENNLKFQIDNPKQLLALLKNLSKKNLLTRKPIKEIIEFSDDSNKKDNNSNRFVWSRATFVDYLDYEKDEMAPEDYSIYSKLVNEIDESSLTPEGEIK